MAELTEAEKQARFKVVVYLNPDKSNILYWDDDQTIREQRCQIIGRLVHDALQYFHLNTVSLVVEEIEGD